MNKQRIPDTHAVTIATWPEVFILGQMRRFRAVRAVLDFELLGDPLGEWFDSEDEYYNRFNTSSIMLVENTEVLGDRIIVAIHIVSHSGVDGTITITPDPMGVSHPEELADLHICSLWLDVLGMNDLGGEFKSELRGQYRRMMHSPFKRMLRPKFTFDASPYVLLGLQPPWMGPSNSLIELAK